MVGASLVLGCGDDEPARDQTVFWMSLSANLGQMCSSIRSYSLPDDTARSIITGSGQGERLVDGDDAIVECTVSESGAGQFNVAFDLSSGEIGSFGARGTVSKMPNADGTGTFNINFVTTQFSLEQDGCTATVEEALEGALWVSNLSCPTFGDPRSPSIACTGTGGFILENCSR